MAGTDALVSMTVCAGKRLHTLPAHPILGELPGFSRGRLTNKIKATHTQPLTPPNLTPPHPHPPTPHTYLPHTPTYPNTPTYPTNPPTHKPTYPTHTPHPPTHPPTPHSHLPTPTYPTHPPTPTPPTPTHPNTSYHPFTPSLPHQQRQGSRDRLCFDKVEFDAKKHQA